MPERPAQGRGPLPWKFQHEPERYRTAAELIAAMRRGKIGIQREAGFPEEATPRNIDARLRPRRTTPNCRQPDASCW